MISLNVILNGARGGQGTSTVAAVLALTAARLANAQLSGHDVDATAALLGVHTVTGDHASVTHRLTLTAAPTVLPLYRSSTTP